MPRRALWPVATSTAIGAARPMAQGQATTSTATPRAMANAAPEPDSSQAATETAAIPITAGTNTPATRSAARWIGIFSACARRTAAAMRDSVLSPEGRVTVRSKKPLRFIAPARTGSGAARSTGTLSPVSADSSRLAPPETMSPSSGTRSPGRTRRRAPTATRSTGTSVSSSPATTRAARGVRASRPESASEARPRARVSKYRPRVTNAITSAAVSKKSGAPGRKRAATEAA